MAWLLWESGEHELVEHVVATRNNATVHQLVDEPGLAAWLSRNGLSVDEAARIQPSYDSYDSYEIHFITPSYDVRLGSCSPPIRFEAFSRGTTQRVDEASATVETGDSVTLFHDATCSTLAPKTSWGGRAGIHILDGGGAFFFRPDEEGAVDISVTVRGSLAAQQHHAFALDGGYRIPVLDNSLPVGTSGCSTVPGNALLLLPLVLWAWSRARRGAAMRSCH